MRGEKRHLFLKAMPKFYVIWFYRSASIKSCAPWNYIDPQFVIHLNSVWNTVAEMEFDISLRKLPNTRGGVCWGWRKRFHFCSKTNPILEVKKDISVVFEIQLRKWSLTYLYVCWGWGNWFHFCSKTKHS